MFSRLAQGIPKTTLNTVSKRSMAVYKLGTLEPNLPKVTNESGYPGYFIAPSASVIGQVTLGEDSTVWYGAVIRADNDKVTIGKNTNIQDAAIVHVDDGFPVVMGDNVTIGHKAIIHGCTIGNNTLVGMGAVILNGAVVGNNCLIGANALVLEKTVIPDNSLVVGSPAKIVRQIDESRALMLTESANGYSAKGKLYHEQLQQIA